MSNYFVATEKSEYSIGSPPGNFIWGKNIDFDEAGGWVKSEINSGYDVGTKFSYTGSLTNRLLLTCIFDCKIKFFEPNDGENALGVHFYINGRKANSQGFRIIKKRQIVCSYQTFISTGAEVQLRLSPRNLTNDIQFGTYPQINEFSGQSDF